MRNPFASRRLRRLARWAVALGLAGLVAFLALDRLFPFPTEALRRPSSIAVLDRSGEPLRLFLAPDERWRFPVRLADLPPALPRAVVACEDRRFYLHPGVDPLAVVRAAATDLAAGRVVSGASTLPMQVARMVDPRPRTLGAKLVEAFRALELDLRFSKAEILEMYLNLAPYGGNLEGVGAAARFYFGKRPEQLSLGEIALLVALPRSPVALDPTRHPEAARAARDEVLAELVERGVATPLEAAAAGREPVPRRWRPLPFAAPHLARRAAAVETRGTRRRTTLDRHLQQVAEAKVASRIGELRAVGIGNAAAVVVDNRTREVRAYVGSAGFAEEAFDGQVDGAAARRSPGSTLKPFLYAMAFDDGRLVPASYLLDVPRDYAGYVPENYDGRYRGRVTAREALVASLNAPAVALLAEEGLPRFLGLLRRGGLATLDRTPAEYGLPLILGAGEVTLLDLVGLYASLADGGLYRPVRFLEPAAGGEEPAGERLVSPGAAALVTEILADVRRPDLPDSWRLARDVPAVAWKTGTSFGHRDAWAVGFSSRYTIGVWVGSFDGRAVRGISGSHHAAPLLFDLFGALNPGGSLPQEGAAARAERGTVEVCALSHQLPQPFCPERVRIEVLPGRSRLGRCTYHRRAFVDAVTGEVVTGACLAARPHRPRVLTLWPAELVAWWRGMGQEVPGGLPAVRRGCGGPPGEGPAIVSPDPATPYHRRRGVPAGFQKIPLVARTGGYGGRLFWYQDGTLVASGPPGERLFLLPRPGVHRIVVVDEAGRSDSVALRVE